MPGSIRKRADRGKNVYELRVLLGRDDYGRVRHKSTIFRGPLRAAEMELARLVIEQAAEPDPIPVGTAFGPTTTINMAIEARKENGWQDLSPGTTRRYNSIWPTHIKESIGRRLITSLGPYDVEVYLRGLKASGLSGPACARPGRSCTGPAGWPASGAATDCRTRYRAPRCPIGCSTSSVKPCLRRALKRSRRSSPPRRRSGPVCTVSSRSSPPRACGEGKPAPCDGSDIDFSTVRLTIDESVVAADGGAQVKAPKSRAGVRAVAIDRTTAATLLALPGIVPPHPDAMSHAFGRIRAAAGVPADVHLHSLRHFQATLLDPIISEAQKQSRLGWSTVDMARHYTDGLEEEDRRAAQHMGLLLSGGVVDAVPQAGQTPASRGVNRSVTPS